MLGAMRSVLSVLLMLMACAVSAAGDLDALLARGDAEDQRLETSAALATYLAAEKLAPNDANVLYRISREYALSMYDTSVKDEQHALAEQALDYARRAIAADADNANAQLAAAICYGRLTSFVDVRRKIEYARLIKQHGERAIELDGNNSYAWHVMGMWNYELAKISSVQRKAAKVLYGEVPPASYDLAVEHFRKAVRLAPYRVSHHVELGRAYLAMGRKVEARSELEKALSLPAREKDDPESRRHATEALKKIRSRQLAAG